MSSLATSLLRWFDAERRHLPWRESRDPYRIWVSEVMLQQTRVDTVVPYYRRFVERFPNVESLAAANQEEVLSLWSGLGYYRRARQLHAAARTVAAAGGRLPETVEGLLKLPGIGGYTAAAIASMAFGVTAPVLDGNVIRVTARLLASEEDPRRAAGRKTLLAAAERLLTAERPGDGNQALMELGATVCTPRAPGCPRCPLAAGCAARVAGDPERYPAPRVTRPTESFRLLGAVVRRGSRTLLFRRSAESRLLAGTWEVPWVELTPGEAPEGALARRYGGSWRLGGLCGRVKHGITHRLLEVEVRDATFEAGEAVAERGEAGWFNGRQIAGLPISSLVRKVLNQAGTPANKRG